MMTEIILTISIVGLLAGFIFSMPIAGPISIVVTTNAFRGRVRYCHQVSIGASIITFAYVFLAVFGLSKLYLYYKPAVPYLLASGSFFLLYLGYRIFRTRFEMSQFEDNANIIEKANLHGRGGYYTGLIINLLNPTLFIGWLTSTFLVISFVTSLGFNMGSLGLVVDQGVREISKSDVRFPADTRLFSPGHFELNPDIGINVPGSPESSTSSYFHLTISLFYALFIAAGSIIWFYILTFLLNRFRNRINIKILTKVIHGMGVILCLFGIYFGWLAITIIFNKAG